jgi:hypothetical protein
MKTLAVDSNNDIYVGNDGNLSVNLDLQATIETCAQAAKAQLGEMVLDMQRGIPNFQTVWNGKPNVAQFEAYLRRTITEVPTVTGITELTIVTEGDILNYSASITTIYGSGVINESL